MTNILDRVLPKAPVVSFIPKTVQEVVGLRLARKLGEPAAVEHYAMLARQHFPETLTLAYRNSVNNGRSPLDLAKRFHHELAQITEQRNNHHRPERLMAIKIERRCVAVAVFVDSQLDYHDKRTLGAQSDKADDSAMGFLRWVIRNFQIDSAVLERMTNGTEIRRAVLNQVVLKMLRDSAIPVWEVSKAELLEAYGHPPLISRKKLREAAYAVLWSMFNTIKPHCQEIDAAALGLHVQTERLFLY